MSERRQLDFGLTRRQLIQAGSGVVGLAGVGGVTFADRSTPVSIQTENSKPGDGSWFPSGAPERSIEGYTSETSVAPGGTVEFHVSTKPSQQYRIDVYRVGWYDSKGGRLVRELPESEGRPRSQPNPDAETGLVECDWPVTDTFDVPSNLTTGLYLAHFVLTSGPNRGKSTADAFFVRPSEQRTRQSNIVVQMPIATSQAYNSWGGKSLYGFQSDGEPADKISYHRPHGIPFPGNHLGYAIHAVRFLESEGYEISYVSDVDVHRNPDLLRDYQLAISAGHDEYWSQTQRDAFEAAQDDGVNLVFLGANICYWQIRYEDDESTIVGYKKNIEDDPRSGTQRQTSLFRNLPTPRPESELEGVQFDGATYGTKYPDYTVVEEALDHPWMEGTGFEPGDTLTSLVGYEWDRIFPENNVPELTQFFHYEDGSEGLDISRPNNADSVGYTADSDAQVFSTGSLNFSWGLDPAPDEWGGTLYQQYSTGYDVSGADPRLQRFMRNILDDLIQSTTAPETSKRPLFTSETATTGPNQSVKTTSKPPTSTDPAPQTTALHTPSTTTPHTSPTTTTHTLTSITAQTTSTSETRENTPHTNTKNSEMSSSTGPGFDLVTAAITLGVFIAALVRWRE